MENCNLSRVELFAFTAQPATQGPDRKTCRPILLRLSCGDRAGYGECLLPDTGKPIDLIRWGAFLKGFRNATLEEAHLLTILHADGWTPDQVRMARAALAELAQSVSLQERVPVGVGSRGIQKRSVSSTLICNHSKIQQVGDDRFLDELFEQSISYYSIF
ncbi:hypothetical protein [Gorillibacterium massiliense]|uniref:hypothetical protein n=1 Tax=Gorillibacterium massiliense TaxID=1280390 RepID=UPI00059326C3|nr:hypothetical protein [Gorillibacterium massiliense]